MSGFLYHAMGDNPVSRADPAELQPKGFRNPPIFAPRPNPFPPGQVFIDGPLMGLTEFAQAAASGQVHYHDMSISEQIFHAVFQRELGDFLQTLGNVSSGAVIMSNLTMYEGGGGNPNGGGGDDKGDGGDDDRYKATILADAYDQNENLEMAYTIVLDGLVETSEVGELVTKAREELVEIYGTDKSKNVNKVYSQAIDVIRQIKSEVPSGKLSDEYIFTASIAIGLEIIHLQIVNSVISLRIKYLDQNVYINRITPEKRINGFGGAGASGSW